MDEVIESLDLQATDIVVDGTINGGGHSLEIVKHLSDSGVLIGIDLDKSALEVSQKKLREEDAQINLVHNNFRNIDEIVHSLGLSSVDKILLDLGWSSNQFENPERGFSFMHDGPLLMTLSGDSDDVDFTAYDIVNTWSEESLMDILEVYGEEKYAWHIVQAILKQREKESIYSTLQLAEIISNAVPKKYTNGRIHPATKTFQALRIAVNDEMGALKDVLEKGFNLLSDGGRMAIISFHSVEDRIVKNFFRKKKQEGLAKLLTKKPQVAGEKELQENRRARSAKLRVLIKN
jgi:16S rRNA (cytosine1402-N4)-methyltransferase